MFQDKEFLLLNKDEEIARFRIGGRGFFDGGFKLLEPPDPSRAPFGFSGVESWLAGRRAPKHRVHISNLLKQCGCETVEGFARVTHALSLNDTFWVKPSRSGFSWNDVSLFRNEFDEVVARIAFEGGLHGEMFSSTSPEFSTDGSYAKCWIRRDGEILLQKTGSRGASNAGLEPYSEAMASQLADAFLDASATYSVIPPRNAAEVRLTSSLCPLFTSEQVGFVQYGKLFGDGEETAKPPRMLEFYSSVGSETAFRKMVVFDALCLNVDRHLGNHGVLFDADTLELIGMAPVFDNNLSFLPLLPDDELDGIEDEIRGLKPKIGGDFNEAAADVATPSIRRELRNLKGFEFDRAKLPGLPEERIAAMEKLVERQIRAVLGRETLYVEKELQETEEDRATLEGWPDDEPDAIPPQFAAGIKSSEIVNEERRRAAARAARNLEADQEKENGRRGGGPVL